MSDRQLATINTTAAVELSRADIEILKATVLKGATDDQLRFFARACRAKGLDPFSREVHGAVNREGGVELIVGIDGLRHQAEQSGEYAGQEPPLYYDENGVGHKVWLGGKGKRPLACEVCVRRRKPHALAGSEIDTTCAVAVTLEVQRNTATWDRHFLTMLAVRAEAHALRRAFPRQASGLYLRDELDDETAPVTGGSAGAEARERPAAKRPGNPGRAAARPDVKVEASRPRSRPAEDPATQGDEDDAIEATVVTKDQLDDLVGGDSAELVDFSDSDEDLVNATAKEGRELHQLKKALGWSDKDYDAACLEQVGQSGALSLARTKHMIAHMERLAEARGVA